MCDCINLRKGRDYDAIDEEEHQANERFARAFACNAKSDVLDKLGKAHNKARNQRIKHHEAWKEENKCCYCRATCKCSKD